MKIRNCFLILSIFLICSPFIISDPVDIIIDTAVAEIGSAITEIMVVGTGVFIYADKGVSSTFSYFLQEKFAAAILRNDKFELADRKMIDTILEEVNFGLSGLVDKSTAIKPGQLRGLQGILSCRFFNEGEIVRVFSELLNVETGLIMSSKESIIQKTDIPRHITILPDNYNNAMYVIDELSELMNASNENFVIKTWTKRGDGGTYKDGEKMVINFFSSRDCFIKLYHIDVNGEISLIFPNPYLADNFITANTIYKIPDSRYPFSFTLGAPYGIEFVKVIASTVQFTDIEESFTSMGKAGEYDGVSRGLSVVQNIEQTTEGLISYTIIE
jgi:hypothetical protein